MNGPTVVDVSDIVSMPKLNALRLPANEVMGRLVDSKVVLGRTLSRLLRPPRLGSVGDDASKGRASKSAGSASGASSVVRLPLEAS